MKIKKYLIIIPVLISTVLIFFISKSENANDMRSSLPFFRKLHDSGERILRLDQKLFLKKREFGSMTLTEDTEPYIQRDYSLLKNDNDLNISQLFENYISLLSDTEVYNGSSGYRFTDKHLLILKNQNDDNSKISLGNRIYLGDRLKYLHSENWMFELEINDVLFWVEKNDSEEKPSMISLERKEESVVTFSGKYSF